MVCQTIITTTELEKMLKKKERKNVSLPRKTEESGIPNSEEVSELRKEKQI